MGFSPRNAWDPGEADPAEVIAEQAFPNPEVLTMLGHQGLHGAYFDNIGSGVGSGAQPTANVARYVPFWVENTYTVRWLGIVNGGGVSGNWCVAIYDDDGTGGGPGTRLLTTGSVAQAGVTQIQAVSVGPLDLAPGYYYLASVLDNNVGQVQRLPDNVQSQRLTGVMEQAAAFPLPASATPVVLSAGFVALAVMSSRAAFP